MMNKKIDDLINEYGEALNSFQEKINSFDKKANHNLVFGYNSVSPQKIQKKDPEDNPSFKPRKPT